MERKPRSQKPATVAARWCKRHGVDFGARAKPRNKDRRLYAERKGGRQ